MLLLRTSKLSVLLLLILSGFAQVPKREQKTQQQMAAQPAPAQAQQQAAHELTASDLDAFFSGMLPAQIESNNVAGAVVAVVKDGHAIYEKGFGYADVKARKPVTADATLFRPGSISKLFAWTAVMQLVERRKLDLDRDVNDYLDFRIPPAFGKPITLRNIMTHTPGFEETIKDLIVKGNRSAPIRDYLTRHMPGRIFLPGEFGAYSNYATGVAGYIVQRVSGERFEDYIVHHIFTPLGMQRATFEQPLPANLKDMMSNGYKKATEDAKPFELVSPAPAGALSITADDIAHFMIAHLNRGAYNDAQILRPETAELMHSAQWKPGPGLNSMCLGFYEDSRNGHRVIAHGGDLQWFHSDLHLVLDTNVGIFISYNSEGRGEGGGRAMIYRQFMDRYFPQQPREVKAIASEKQDARSLTGEYMSTRRSQTNIMWITEMLGETTVAANSDGSLKIYAFKGPNGEVRKWEEGAPGAWRANDGDRESQVDFLDKNGVEVMAFEFPAAEFQRVRWYQSKRLNKVLLGYAFAIAALTTILWPLAALLRKHYGVRLELDAAHMRRRRLVYLTCCAVSAFFVYGMLLMSKLDNIEALTEAFDLPIRLLQFLAWIATLGTMVTLVNLFSPWSRQRPWWGSRLSDFLIATACLGFVWIAAYWRILTGSLHY